MSSSLPHPNQPYAVVAGGLGVVQLRSYEGAGTIELGRRRLRTQPLEFSADGQRLATSAWDHAIRIWPLWRPELPRFFVGDNVRAGAWSSDGKTIITGSGNYANRGVICAWHVATGTLAGPALVLDSQVSRLLSDATNETLAVLRGWSFEGNLDVLAPGADGQLSMRGETIETGQDDHVLVDGQLLDGERIVVADVTGELRIYDLATHAQTHGFEVRPPEAGPTAKGRLLAVCATPDATELWCGGTTGYLHHFKRQPDDSYLESEPIPIGECINVLRLLPNDGGLVVGGMNGLLQRRTSGGEVLAFLGHQDEVLDVDYSAANGTPCIASCDVSGSVRLWRVDGTLIREIRSNEGRIWCVRFSPDGERLLTTSVNGIARIWPVRLEVGR